jgi:dsRNA-specific ribonuclease
MADDSCPPTKKQRLQPKDAAEILAGLQEGLAYLQSTPGYNKDARALATDLQKLLFQRPASPPKEDPAQTQPAKKVDHTDVPPPFPVHTPIPPPFGGQHPAANMGQVVRPAACKLPVLPPITDLSLLSAPFTHTSTLPHYVNPTGTNTYEPMEFLGDAYLEVIATRMIHDRFPHHNVGQKAGLRETLIRNETLAQYAKEYGFGERIKATGLDKDHGGKAWIKILADVFEAYVAAVILSDDARGMTTATEWLTALWEPRIKDWRENGLGVQTAEQERHANNDVKSLLQRVLVSKGVKVEYIEERPMEHIKDGNKTTFWMGVYLTGWGYNKARLGGGSGRSKQIAGAEAAKDAFISGKWIVDDAHLKKLEHDRMKLATANRLAPNRNFV